MREEGAAAEVRIRLLGQGCASCASLLAQRLRKEEGVLGADLNIFTWNATVKFDPSKTSGQKILEEVRKSGIEAFETRGRLP